MSLKPAHCMQVAAYCDGRLRVEEGDLFLLQHVLWQRPEHVDKIYDWVPKQVEGGTLG